MRIEPFRAVFPNLDYVASPDEFFGTVKEKYTAYRDSGFFVKSAQEAIYLYSIKSKLRSYTGLIVCNNIHDFIDGKIKKHENTLAAKEQQQMHLMIARGACVKPVLLTYPRVNEISQLMENFSKELTPLYSVTFEKDQQKHTIWEIKNGKDIDKIQKLFAKKVPFSYIADGHHRTSTTALLYERMKEKKPNANYDLLLSVYFPSDQLSIFDYNRVVEALDEVSVSVFMAKISKYFDIEILDKAIKPRQKHEIIMFLNKEWFSLRWKDQVLEEYKDNEVILDANLLDEKVLTGIIGIEDVRTDLRIQYVEGPKGLKAIRSKTLKDKTKVGFLLFPVELNDLITIADANKVMPPKSTWFEPRIKNGLLVQEY